MIQTINIKTTTNSALYNKGVDCGVSVAESLSTESKKDEKNIANYLVVPNNFVLSLSLSLSLSYRPGLISPLFSSRIRARGVPCKRCKQRTFRSFLCSLFVSICELSKRKNKDVLSIDFTTKDTCNSLVIFCFLSLISRAGSDNALSACRGGENGWLGGIDDKVIRMYIIKGEQRSHIIESR